MAAVTHLPDSYVKDLQERIIGNESHISVVTTQWNVKRLRKYESLERQAREDAARK